MRNIKFLIFILLLNIFSHKIVYSQSLTPIDINSSGLEYEADGYIFSLSIGGSFVTTLSDSINIISQGFQQLDFLTIGIDSINSQISIQIFPNPCKIYTLLNFSRIDEPFEARIEICSPHGYCRTIKQEFIENDINIIIELNEFPAGLYFLNFYKQQDSRPFSIKKLVKIK